MGSSNNTGNEESQREKRIIQTSMIGIGANAALAAFKAVIGIVSGSIAITLDAVNNLSDAASSAITIVGTKLAGREPDKKHPFGYGRIEYMTAMIIAVLVLYAGLTSLTESVKKIISPQTPDYSSAALVIVAAGVAVKILLGRYVKSVGQKVQSDSLVNSGQDALLDSVISASTLAAALIYLGTGLSLEAWLGAVISLVIIKSGVEMLKDTLSRILGERADAGLVKEIKKTVLEAFPDIAGVYDVVLHDYGPDAYQGSAHIEVPDTYTANQLDELIRAVQMTVYKKHNVLFTAIGVYSINTKDEKAIAMREEIRALATAHPYILQMHGFFLNQEKKTLRFDLVVSFDAPDRLAAFKEAMQDLQAHYPQYTFQAAMDRDFLSE